MARKRVSVTKESPSKRNLEFRDNYTQEKMTRPDFVRRIKNGDYPNYHIRKINGIETPVSNPDESELNNLD